MFFFFSDIKRGQKKKKKVVCLKHVYVTGSICSRIAELQEDERERESAKKNPMAAVVRWYHGFEPRSLWQIGEGIRKDDEDASLCLGSVSLTHSFPDGMGQLGWGETCWNFKHHHAKHLWHSCHACAIEPVGPSGKLCLSIRVHVFSCSISINVLRASSIYIPTYEYKWNKVFEAVEEEIPQPSSVNRTEKNTHVPFTQGSLYP